MQGKVHCFEDALSSRRNYGNDNFCKLKKTLECRKKSLWFHGNVDSYIFFSTTGYEPIKKVAQNSQRIFPSKVLIAFYPRTKLHLQSSRKKT